MYVHICMCTQTHRHTDTHTHTNKNSTELCGPLKYLSLIVILIVFVVLNIGTSSQLAVVTDRETASRSIADCSTLLQVPYFAGKHLVVAAALTGGNAMAHFVEQIQKWCGELGISVPSKDDVYQSLFDSAKKIEGSSLHVSPLLWGERHLPSGRGAVLDLDTLNTSLGDITHAVCRGIVTNIKKMMPEEVFISSKVRMLHICAYTGAAYLVIIPLV